MCSRWTLQEFTSTRQCLRTLNINGTMSLFFCFFPLPDLFSVFVRHDFGASESHSEQEKSFFEIYRTLKSPQPRQWISIPYTLWVPCWWPQPQAAMWKETRKRNIYLHGAKLYPSHLIHPLHAFIFGHIAFFLQLKSTRYRMSFDVQMIKASAAKGTKIALNEMHSVYSACKTQLWGKTLSGFSWRS